MKKLIILIVSTTCLISSSYSLTKVACLGNSITQGGPGNNYPEELSYLFGDSFEVKNFGVSGRTLLKKGDQPIWNESKYTESLNYNPNVVVILLGANDSRTQNWYYKADFLKDYIALIQSYTKLQPHVMVYVCLPLTAFTNVYGIRDEIISSEIIPLIRQAADATGARVIDLHTPTSDKSYLLYDGVHPKVEGSYELAKIIYSSVIGKPLVKTRYENLLVQKAITSNVGSTSGFATDNDFSTHCEMQNDADWLKVDLGESQLIDNFQLFFLNEKPKGFSYTIETSEDGNDWTMQATQDFTSRETPDFYSHQITPTNLRYIRLSIHKDLNGATPVMRISEFKALKSVGSDHTSTLYTSVNPNGNNQLVTSIIQGLSAITVYKKSPGDTVFSFVSLTHKPYSIPTFSQLVKPGSSYYAVSFLKGVEYYSDTVFVSFIDPQVSVISAYSGSNDVIIFPNPFREELNIKNIPGRSNLSIFSAEGRLVRTYNNISSSQISWDGCDSNRQKVPSGIYVCRIDAPNYKSELKIVYSR